MGDVNEIRLLIRRESESFLQRALHEAKEGGTSYDFESEFAKTRQNRSFLVWGATAATILALGLAAYGVTLVIQHQAATAPVDVQAFTDLNLKDLLDTAKRNENDLDQAKQELANLDYDYNSAVETAGRAYAAAVESIKARNLPSNQEVSETASAAATRDATERRLRASYLPAAAAKKAQIAEVQAKIDKYDQHMMAQAQQQQAVLDNERRLFDMQMKSQSQLYEGQIAELKSARLRDIASLKRQKDELAAALTARYNPVFGDDRSAALLNAWREPSDSAAVPALSPYLGNRGFIDAGTAARLDQSLSDFLYLEGRLRAVPYLNSIPPALARTQNEAVSAIIAYREALAKTVSALQSEDARILELTAAVQSAQDALGQYRWAVSEFLRSSGEAGYVLDPRDASSIVVALNPAVQATDGSAGYVVRGDKVVARLSFYLKDGALRARVEGTGATLKAFDAVLVEAATPAAQPGAQTPGQPPAPAPATGQTPPGTP